MLEAETIDRIEELAQAALKPVVLECPRDPKHVFRIWNPADRKIEEIEAKPEPRSYTAATIKDLASMIRHFSVEAGVGVAVAMVAEKGVTVLLDETESRRHRIFLPTPLSRPMLALKAAETSKNWLTHREAVSFLRMELGLHQHDVVETLRSIKFSRNEEGESTIRTGNESMGASVNARVGAGIANGDLPDLFRVEIPIFEDCADGDGAEFKDEVRLIVETNMAEQKFRFTPGVGDTARALRNARQWVRETLSLHFDQSSPAAPGTARPSIEFCGSV